MRLKDVSTPDAYKDSADFRFFLKWFEDALTKIHYDTENGMSLYDPLRCPAKLLWMLADTMGFKYDDRLPASFNRFVLVYFMSMIRNRGSKDGVTLAAEANLKQFDIELVAGTGYEDASTGEIVEPKDILYNRLEDTSIPVNSAFVTPHTDKGYIEIVYFSDRTPIDACIEYVRPLGMYCFQHAGVRMDARTKITIDARLTNTNDIGLSIGPTHVGHYSRDDYARMQRLTDTTQDLTRVQTSEPKDSDRRRGAVRDAEHLEWDSESRTARVPKQELTDTRRNAWYRNADYEGGLHDNPVQARERLFNPGYRALYSLQLCNNEHIVQSLVPMKPGEDPDGKDLHRKEQIFGLGWEPQDVTVSYPDDYVLPDEAHEYFIINPAWTCEPEYLFTRIIEPSMGGRIYKKPFAYKTINGICKCFVNGQWWWGCLYASDDPDAVKYECWEGSTHWVTADVEYTNTYGDITMYFSGFYWMFPVSWFPEWPTPDGVPYIGEYEGYEAAFNGLIALAKPRIDGIRRIADWNLRYDKAREEAETADVYTTENSRNIDIVNPRPAVNPVMHVVGDAISIDDPKYPDGD